MNPTLKRVLASGVAEILGLFHRAPSGPNSEAGPGTVVRVQVRQVQSHRPYFCFLFTGTPLRMLGPPSVPNSAAAPTYQDAPDPQIT